jgi:type IV secretory pathway TrbL component
MVTSPEMMKGQKKRGYRKTIALLTLAILVLVLVVFYVSGYFYAGSVGGTNAIVVATAVSCSSTQPATCRVTLDNTGTANLHIVECGISIDGSLAVGKNSDDAAANIPPGTSVNGSCSLETGGGLKGSAVSGYFTLSDGKTVDFAGSWS